MSLLDSIMPGADIKSLHVVSSPKGGKHKTRRNRRYRKKSRRFRGGKGQYLSNVGYSSGYSLPFFTKTMTNII